MMKYHYNITPLAAIQDTTVPSKTPHAVKSEWLPGYVSIPLALQ